MQTDLFQSRSTMRVAPQYQPVCREIGLDGDAVFTHELIRPWRTLPGDRENCTLDATLRSGQSIRWHVKRYQPQLKLTTRAEDEVKGYRALHDARVPTAALVGWGRLSDRRSFVITDDLEGYEDSEKLLQDGGATFEQLLEPTADLAAKLHNAGLHHRDLYLCHFFAKLDGADVKDVRLIDVARVRKLVTPFTRRRWIVKDLAQFWYSTIKLPDVTDELRRRWVNRYGAQRGVDASTLIPAIVRKSNWIARHDAKLRREQPDRNVSIPD
jgi:hypothetical protein